jgi:hypothetical protein
MVKGLGVHVAKVVEITGELTKSIEDAVAMSVDRAYKTMKKFRVNLNPLGANGDALSFIGVHPNREFASILNRERDRVDRTGQEFSMVVYDVGTDNGKLAPAQHLVSILKHRIRSTDEIGWLEDGRIGVVLPHTMPEGAWKFVANIRMAYNGSTPPPDCMVYVYPSGWVAGANGDPSQKHHAGKGFPSGGVNRHVAA